LVKRCVLYRTAVSAQWGRLVPDTAEIDGQAFEVQALGKQFLGREGAPNGGVLPSPRRASTRTERADGGGEPCKDDKVLLASTR
jgi:hypothetical protein